LPPRLFSVRVSTPVVVTVPVLKITDWPEAVTWSFPTVAFMRTASSPPPPEIVMSEEGGAVTFTGLSPGPRYSSTASVVR
jgi:hypothetical protein